MAMEAPYPSGATAPTTHARWWSTDRAQDALLVVLLLLVEVLPVEAWQLVSAGFVGDVTRIAVPFWLLYAAILVPWVICRRGAMASTGSLALAGAPFLLLLYAAMLRLSPGAYGPVARGVFDLGWLRTLAADIVGTTGHSGADILLALLLVYLSWRGLTLARERVTEPEDLVKRFVVGFAVVIAAIIGALPIAARAQHAVLGALALLLPLYVLVGLVATALARVAFTRQTRRDEGGLPGGDGQWLRVALVLSGAIIGFTLVVSIVVNLDALRALLTHLGALGSAINGFGTGAQHAGVPIASGSNPSDQQAACLHGQKLLCDRPIANSGATNPVLAFIAHLAIEALVLLVTALAFFYLARFALRSILTGQRTHDAETSGDIRESLDGRSLLAAQLRGLLRRRGASAAESADPLPRHSVRALYRDVLQTTALWGLRRMPSETPDEYAERLAHVAPLASESEAAQSLVALSDAYDAARYAEREPEPSAYELLRQHTSHLIRLFTRSH